MRLSYFLCGLTYGAIGLVVTNLWGDAAPLHAKPIFANTVFVAQSPPDTPPPPRANKPRPRGRLGNVCSQKQQLTALIPETKATGWLTTLSETPIIWFYIPYDSSQVVSIEFTLNSQDEKTTVYRGQLSTLQSPGVVGLQLPASVKLEPNKGYYWYLHLSCKQQGKRLIRETVEGNLFKLDSTDARRSQVKVASAEIWYDALTVVASRRATTTDPDWERLLTSIGRADLVKQPILPIVRLPEPK